MKYLILLVPLLLLACRERVTREAFETSRASQIVQTLVDEGASLPIDARLAVTSYMDAERIRIELKSTEFPPKAERLAEKLAAAEAKQTGDQKRYEDSMLAIWDAVRESEDPNLAAKDRQVLTDYLPQAKATAERVEAAYKKARAAADRYLAALRELKLDEAQTHHAAYLATLSELLDAGHAKKR
ncbi:hypothetical protein [Luteolibacter luteus]|uniref:Uncharacterized protein n=1 Tax=Luteolibacter luteus TaxID=2728835 RepID=A0A858RE81_9BACT|nr:hypothetical protein [Luteolibacter luteus]QJE95127.1 hypothetical protein HHL09_04855 [Luteolibacter luteus]